jgi:DNA-binding transcriptional regulator YiaG
MSVVESLSTAVLVKEIRKRLGLTQLQLAQTLGVSFQSVNRWERSKTNPLPIVLKLLEVMVKEIDALAKRAAFGIADKTSKSKYFVNE